MEDYSKEEQKEMLRQVARYESCKRTGEKAWFDSDNYVDIIDWYYMQEMNDDADNVVREAYSVFPYDEDIVYRYAGLFATNGEFEKAEQIIKKALEINPCDELRIDLASLYTDWGKHYDQALKILLEIESRDKDNCFIYMMIGRIYLDKEDFISAEKYLRQGILLNQNEKILLGCYVDCAYEPSLEDTMIRFLYELSHKHPFNDSIWTALGIVYSRYEFYDEAVEALDLAIAIEEKGELRHTVKADCLVAKQDYKNAIKELNIALKYLDSEPPEILSLLASLLMKEHRFADALIQLQKVDRHHDDMIDKTYLFNLALCYYYLNNPVKARETVESILANKYFPSEIIVDFARRLYDNEFYSESEDLFESIITNNMDSNIVELASITLAALKSRDGNTFEAVRIMENTLAELHTCTEDFWYAFLRITCQDSRYDTYTMKTLRLLMRLDSFPTYIKEHYPEIVDNPNYKRCLKDLYHV